MRSSFSPLKDAELRNLSDFPKANLFRDHRLAVAQVQQAKVPGLQVVVRARVRKAALESWELALESATHCTKRFCARDGDPSALVVREGLDQRFSETHRHPSSFEASGSPI